MISGNYSSGLGALWLEASNGLGPYLSDADQQRLCIGPFIMQQAQEIFIDNANGSDTMNIDEEPLPQAAIESMALSEEEPYYDPVFLNQFGIKTQVLFTTDVTVDEDCEEQVDACWEKYETTFTLKPSKEDRRVAQLFEDCIDRSTPDGNDPWTRKYGIEWLGETLGYGIYAKKQYNPGDVIGYYAGYLTDSVQDKDYAFEFEGSSFEGLHIDARLASNAMRYMNHTSDELANAKTVEYYYDGLPFIMFVATDQINPGDKIQYNYGDGYWETKIIKPIIHQNNPVPASK